jgi:hypothetical protein
MILDKKNKGSLFFSGNAYVTDSESFRVERRYEFSYMRVNVNRVIMDKFSMQKRDTDNVPDVIFNNIAWSTHSDPVYFEISKFKNSYIISNPFSPLMVCIKRGSMD